MVTAHGQRGLARLGPGPRRGYGRDALGHESFKTTAQSYARADGVGLARQTRVLSVLEGGKSGATRAE